MRTKANTGVLRYALRASLRMTGTKIGDEPMSRGRDVGQLHSSEEALGVIGGAEIIWIPRLPPLREAKQWRRSG